SGPRATWAPSPAGIPPASTSRPSPASLPPSTTTDRSNDSDQTKSPAFAGLFSSRQDCLRLAVSRRQRAQPKRIQPDEPFRILLVVGATVVLEGDEIVAIERL